MKTPGVLSTVRELRARVARWRREGARIGLIPTMGALHCGHLALVTAAANCADRVVVSIFVNPAQFAPHEDFKQYPRNVEQDISRLAESGATDTVFAPSTSELYPDGFATKVEIGGPTLGLESDYRPHFFSGVATVVTKLLIAASPDIAVFGEKDYQQLLVVRRLVRDLGLDVEVLGVPVVRESDGLALSSRNAYLGGRERQIASHLNRVLGRVAEDVREARSIADAERHGRASLLEKGFDSVDYVAVRDAQTLALPEKPDGIMRVLAAATIAGIRLIDSVPV